MAAVLPQGFGVVAWGAVAAIPLLGDGIAWLRKVNKLRKACPNSFVPGTNVALADGTTTNIEDIKVGDKAEATDPETGKIVARAVLATMWPLQIS